MRPSALLTTSLALTIPILLITLTCGAKGTVANARGEIQDAFETVLEAYDAGGHVGRLVSGLNEALSLVSKAEGILDADPNESERLAGAAQMLAHNVALGTLQVKEEGLQRKQMQNISMSASLSSLLVLGVILYFSGPVIFLRIWVRLKRNCRVTVRDSHRKGRGSMVGSEEVWAVVFAVILAGAVFAASQIFFAGKVAEPFSELAVLGPGMKISDYPKEVVAGQTVKLNVYVGNQMGRPIYYIVMVELGDNKTKIDPAGIDPIMKLERVLLHNETWIFPIDITLTRTGLNQRIIFELWMYNETLNSFEYHHRWSHLWVNVTGPPLA